MSTLEQCRRWRKYYDDTIKAQDRGVYEYKPMDKDLIDLRCGAKTRAGTPCKRRGLYINGRCRLHGGLSTGPKTEAGKKKSAENLIRFHNKAHGRVTIADI